VKAHPTAVVAKDAEIAPDVEIGPYAIIGPHVRLGAGTKVSSHVVIEGHTRIGERCSIYPGACLGLPPQDKKFTGGLTWLVIGDDNVIREHVTMHSGSQPESSTVVGARNYFMVGSHVGHDCRVGDDAILANSAALGGFVVVEDRAVLGGLVGVHQFCRVGKLAMVGALAKVSMDIAPFSVADGNPARFAGPNVVGLRRAAVPTARIMHLKKALKILLASALSTARAIERVRDEVPKTPEIDHLLTFIRASKRGVSRVHTEA